MMLSVVRFFSFFHFLPPCRSSFRMSFANALRKCVRKRLAVVPDLPLLSWPLVTFRKCLTVQALKQALVVGRWAASSKDLQCIIVADVHDINWSLMNCNDHANWPCHSSAKTELWCAVCDKQADNDLSAAQWRTRDGWHSAKHQSASSIIIWGEVSSLGYCHCRTSHRYRKWILRYDWLSWHQNSIR